METKDTSPPDSEHSSNDDVLIVMAVKVLPPSAMVTLCTCRKSGRPCRSAGSGSEASNSTSTLS